MNDKIVPVYSASIADEPFVVNLQKRFSNQIGFLPRAALTEAIGRNLIAVAVENGTPAGYMLIRPAAQHQPWCASIIQAAVELDAQRHSHGRNLLAHLLKRANRVHVIQAWCRSDLEANAFWQQMGFSQVALLERQSARKKSMVLYRKALTNEGRKYIFELPKRAGWRAARCDNIRQTLFQIEE